MQRTADRLLESFLGNAPEQPGELNVLLRHASDARRTVRASMSPAAVASLPRRFGAASDPAGTALCFRCCFGSIYYIKGRETQMVRWMAAAILLIGSTAGLVIAQTKYGVV